ncbi:MAG: TadE/TadG family type IV pilus assembly protein [Acidimicrobiia bacterium]|nr:TadE/TadG family type IV pilus assembly protein [Acidimicrobiia bacterium]
MAAMDSARFAHEKGLTSTELAVLMPVLIALVLIPFQVTLWWHADQIADAAAREAVDAAQVATATEEDGTRAAEWFLDAAGNITDPEVTVTRTADTVSVEVTGRAPRLVPGFDWQVTARAAGPIERFIREDERFGITEGLVGLDSGTGGP